MEKILEAVKINCEKSQEKQVNDSKKKISSKKSEESIIVGDKVLLFDTKRKKKKGGAMKPNFLGPYVVHQIGNCGNVKKFCPERPNFWPNIRSFPDRLPLFGACVVNLHSE